MTVAVVAVVAVAVVDMAVDVSVAQEQLQTWTISSTHATKRHQGGSQVVVRVTELRLLIVAVELSMVVTEIDEEVLAVLEKMNDVAVTEVDDEALMVVVVTVGEVVVAEMMVAVGLV